MTDEENKIAAKELIIKGYNDKIEMLSGIITNQEEQKRKLDTTLASHNALGLDITKNQNILFELLKEIESKKQTSSDVGGVMTGLLNQKLILQKEIEVLDLSVAQKKEYISDIEHHQNVSAETQKEMEAFQDEHAENKKRAEQELLKVKNQIKSLYTAIGSIANKN